ncbi:hypothetical protein PISMIDRAFT_686794, partial [Pisolithus microcarpus 441]
MHPSFYTTLQLSITPPTACREVRNGQTPLQNHLATLSCYKGAPSGIRLQTRYRSAFNLESYP